MFNLFAKYQYVHLNQADTRTVLIDEGFIGRVVTLFAYRRSKPVADDVRAYVRLAPKPRAVLRIRLSLDECFSRMSSRVKGLPTRFETLSPEQRMETMENCQKCIDIAVAELSTLDVPVIDIDGKRSPSEQVTMAASALGLNFNSPDVR
jgi:hypothetical protein